MAAGGSSAAGDFIPRLNIPAPISTYWTCGIRPAIIIRTCSSRRTAQARPNPRRRCSRRSWASGALRHRLVATVRYRQTTQPCGAIAGLRRYRTRQSVWRLSADPRTGTLDRRRTEFATSSCKRPSASAIGSPSAKPWNSTLTFKRPTTRTSIATFRVLSVWQIAAVTLQRFGAVGSNRRNSRCSVAIPKGLEESGARAQQCDQQRRSAPRCDRHPAGARRTLSG